MFIHLPVGFLSSLRAIIQRSILVRANRLSTSCVLSFISSDWISITNGIGQGDPFSMLLFIIYNSDLVETAKGKSELTLAFVDDTAFIAIGKSFEETHSILRSMLEREGGGYHWSRDHNSRFETSKFALIDFTRSRTKERLPLQVRGITIQPSSSHKFLGIIIDQELRWREQANYAIGKGTKYTLLMKRLSGVSWGIPLRLMCQLYQAVVVPRTTYAASIWLCPTLVTNSESNQLRRGSIGTIKKIATTQRQAALTILGALRTSPLDSLEVHAFLPPTHLLIQDILYRSMLRMSRLPQTHPLQPKIKWIKKHNVRRHKSALHHMLHSFDFDPAKIEKYTPYPLHPTDVTPFQTYIASTDKDAIKDYENNKDETKIFTDGSCTEGKVGAAAILYVNNTQIAKLRYHLGSAREHTVFEAELVGLILAVHLLATNELVPYPASIFVDNQAAILASQRPTSKPGHYLSVMFRDIMKEVIEFHDLDKKDVTIRWIASHKNVPGNEAADVEAKGAATDENSTTPHRFLPTALRTSLPISVSALKQAHRELMLAKWKDAWKSSMRHAHIASIDNSLPSKKYMKTMGYDTKSKAGLFFQLRSGHIALNKYLYRFKRSDTPNCQQCDGNVPETVHHLLFDCPRYARERHKLRNKLGRQALSTAYLLGSAEAIGETLSFVKASKRLQPTPGEVQPRQR